ncbi:MAG: PTS sugar transporter subunit IIA [Thermoanaerobaculia bacterium]
MELEGLTRPELIFPSLAGSDQASALWALAESMAKAGVIADAHRVYEKLLEREELGSTGIGDGVAIPHCKVKRLEEVVVAVGILGEAVDFGASDGLPVRLLFLVLSPEKSPAAHLKSLAAISRFVQADSHVQRILERPERDFILELLRQDATEGTGVT